MQWAGMASGTCDAAAQRAAGDEMLHEEASADVRAAATADARSNPGKTCHVWYLATCIPPQRNVVVRVPIGHINLLANL